VVLQDEPNRGLTIIEKLERDTDQIGLGFVLYTPDDAGSPQGEPRNLRVRQNVLFEHGRLIGLPGRDRTCAIVKGDLEAPSSVIVFRYQDECIAYRYVCVHMPRRQDCERDMIFDATGRHLGRSMHGIVYDPISGESLSEICRGQYLTAVEVQENEEGVWIVDKRVRPLIETTDEMD
jgi:nitrite reductase/ring-hydroxylating ferredoxin subunit